MWRAKARPRLWPNPREVRDRTLSDFVREAMDEKLARLEHELLADEVERYCAAGHGEEDGELIAAQAVEPIVRSKTGRKEGSCVAVSSGGAVRRCPGARGNVAPSSWCHTTCSTPIMATRK